MKSLILIFLSIIIVLLIWLTIGKINTNDVPVVDQRLMDAVQPINGKIDLDFLRKLGSDESSQGTESSGANK